MIKLVIDNKEIEAEQGKNLLQTCLENDIYIPNLCHIETAEHPSAACRLCFVEIEGYGSPVTSCTVMTADGMVIRTDTPPVRRLQKTAFQLLLSTHDVNCKECPANKKCELQRIARFLKVGLKQTRFEQHLKPDDTSESHPFLDYFPNRCVLCGKCIHVCRTKHGNAYLTFAKRGINTVVSFYGEKNLVESPCDENHIDCVDVCPVSAIMLKAG